MPASRGYGIGMTRPTLPDFDGSLREATFTASVRDCLRRVPADASSLICLGQTVFWDEIVKALALAACQKHAPEVEFVAAVHDTDYFSKLPGTGREGGGFSLQTHDDAGTRELWAAVAETSSLFGAEVPVARGLLWQAGVPLRALARRHSDGPEAFLEQATAAYGWRGVANHEPHLTVACDVDGHEVCVPLLDLLHWAFAETEQLLADAGDRERLRAWQEALIEAMRGCERELEDRRRLTDLYMRLLELFYEVLLGERPEQLTVSASTELFCFSADTWPLPRFDLVDYFLDPATREAAVRAYDEVVAHSGIYTLDRFGEGAIPLDLTVCGQGRGTIRVLGRRVVVELPGGAVEMEADRELTDRRALAELVSGRFERTCLVGKAVVLPLMVAREWTMLLHEGASAYMGLVHGLTRRLREQGMSLELYPLLRLKCETWDALGAADTAFELPAHLARFFGRGRVSSAELAAGWRQAVRRAEELVADLTAARTPREVLRVLAARGADVAGKRGELAEKTNRRRASAEPIRRLLEQKRELWRPIRPLQRPETTRQEQEELRRLKAEYRGVAQQVQALARAPEHRAAHEEYERVVWEVELLRQQAVSDAVRTQALRASNHRPSWWWFPVVDGTGRWWRRLAQTAEMRFEPFGQEPGD